MLETEKTRGRPADRWADRQLKQAGRQASKTCALVSQLVYKTQFLKNPKNWCNLQGLQEHVSKNKEGILRMRGIRSGDRDTVIVWECVWTIGDANKKQKLADGNTHRLRQTTCCQSSSPPSGNRNGIWGFSWEFMWHRVKLLCIGLHPVHPADA